MNRLRLLSLSALLLSSAAALAQTPAAPAPAASADETKPAWIPRYDELYQTRDDHAALKEMYKLVQSELDAHPNSYEAWWRRAQLDCWQANGMVDGTELKAKVGKQCWDAGEKAVSINSQSVAATTGSTFTPTYSLYVEP